MKVPTLTEEIGKHGDRNGKGADFGCKTFHFKAMIAHAAAGLVSRHGQTFARGNLGFGGARSAGEHSAARRNSESSAVSQPMGMSVLAILGAAQQELSVRRRALLAMLPKEVASVCTKL